MNLTRTSTTAGSATPLWTEPPPPAARAHRGELAAGALAALGAAACIGGGIIEVAHGGLPEKVTTASEHAGLALFAASLLLVVPAVLALGRRAGRSLPAIIAAVGLVALAAVSVVADVAGHDPAIFTVVAPIANAAWLGGFVWVSVRLTRRRLVPRAIAIGLPVSWLCAIPLASHGGGILAGIYWLMVAALLTGTNHRAEHASRRPDTA
jgi:hypothetical protein